MSVVFPIALLFRPSRLVQLKFLTGTHRLALRWISFVFLYGFSGHSKKRVSSPEKLLHYIYNIIPFHRSSLRKL